MSYKIYPPLEKISYFGTMLPLKSREFLIKVLNANGQPFGVDWSGPACRVNSSWPCDKTYYQQLGLGTHNGIDMPCSAGTSVYASTDGIITEVSNDISAGLGVVIFDKSQKCKTVYWHHKENLVSLGQQVKRGDVIALSDSTGYSLGNHLHFMLKETDASGNSINKDNGFGGAIDPVPHIIFEEIMTEQEVTWEYNLAFYRNPTPEELDFWTNKPLADFLTVAIKDRATFLAGQVT